MTPALQDDDLVGHGHGFDLVVGDVDHRRLAAVWCSSLKFPGAC